MRILMVAPYSTLSNLGGAEVASRRLADAMSADVSGRVSEVVHLAALPDEAHAGSPVSRMADGSFVIDGGYSDHLRYVSRRSAWANRTLGDWLMELAPDVVHFHHFLGVGSDLVSLVRRVLPRARVVYTVHEGLLFCANDGKLVRSSGQLCDGPSSLACATCVKAAPVDLMMRDDYFRRLVSDVDALVSPSGFLAGRTNSWLHEDRVEVIGNCPPPESRRDPRPLVPGEGRGRIGFFGQVIPKKGVHVLLDAAIQAGERLDHPLEVLVFGTRPDPVYWGEEIEPRLALLREGPVRASYEGEFRNEDVAEVMALVDWVAVPSLWWENAPTVMFEAMATGRPILAGDIGGMREALEISSAGRSVSVGSVPSWAAALSEVSHPLAADAWGEVQARARLPWTAQEIVDRHLEVYER